MKNMRRLMLFVGLFCLAGLLQAPRMADEFIKQVQGVDLVLTDGSLTLADVVVLDLNDLKLVGPFASDEERAEKLEKNRFKLRQKTFTVSAKYRFFVIDAQSISSFKRASDVVELFEGCAKGQYQVDESTVVCLKGGRDARLNMLLGQISQGLAESSCFDNRGSCFLIEPGLNPASAINQFVCSRARYLKNYSTWFTLNRDARLVGMPYVEEDVAEEDDEPYTPRASKKKGARRVKKQKSPRPAPKQHDGNQIDLLLAAAEGRGEEDAATAPKDQSFRPPVVSGFGSGMVAGSEGQGVGVGAGGLEEGEVPDEVLPSTSCIPVAPVLPKEKPRVSIAPTPTTPQKTLFGGSPASSGAALRRPFAQPSPRKVTTPISQRQIAEQHLAILSPWLSERGIPFVAQYCSSQKAEPEALMGDAKTVGCVKVLYFSSAALCDRNCIFRRNLHKFTGEKTLIFVCGSDSISTGIMNAEGRDLASPMGKYKACVRGISQGATILSEDAKKAILKYLGLSVSGPAAAMLDRSDEDSERSGASDLVRTDVVGASVVPVMLPLPPKAQFVAPTEDGDETESESEGEDARRSGEGIKKRARPSDDPSTFNVVPVPRQRVGAPKKPLDFVDLVSDDEEDDGIKKEFVDDASFGGSGSRSALKRRRDAQAVTALVAAKTVLESQAGVGSVIDPAKQAASESFVNSLLRVKGIYKYKVHLLSSLDQLEGLKESSESKILCIPLSLCFSAGALSNLEKMVFNEKGPTSSKAVSLPVFSGFSKESSTIVFLDDVNPTLIKSLGISLAKTISHIDIGGGLVFTSFDGYDGLLETVLPKFYKA